MKKQSKSADQWNSKRAKAQAKLNDIRSQLERLNFSEAEYESLEKEHRSLSKERVELQDQVDTLTAQLESRLAFQYSDPVRGFDRSKVKGMVAKLVKIFQADHATAVEVAAGGKLYQIVVDEAITSKALLQNGQLKRRVTFVPLDKVQTRRVPANACDQASNMAARMNSKLAVPALDLIGFDEEVRNAMEYVFGTTLVVDGMDAANAICDATKTRTVTLDGDVYDPSGTISGGSRDQLGSTLSKLMLLSDAKKKLDTVIPRVNQVQRKLDAMKDNLTKYEDLSGKMELATAELEGVTKHLSQTSYGIVAEKFKELSAELAEANEESERMRKEQDIKWALYEDLKEREVELTQKRGNRLKEIDEAINQAKKETAEKAERAREASAASCHVARLQFTALTTNTCISPRRN
jgi:structural maintenance of chromosome 2